MGSLLDIQSIEDNVSEVRSRDGDVKIKDNPLFCRMVVLKGDDDK